jgi:hypothetical protein
MKKYTAILLFLSGLNTLSAQSTWQWAVQGGDTWVDAWASCIDNSSNIYSVGQYYSTSSHFGNDTLTITGNVDIFLVKVDNNGNFLWAKRSGSYWTGSGIESASGIEFETSTSSLFFCGQMSGTSAYVDTCNVGAGLYLAQLDTSGDCQWARNFPSLGSFYAFTGITLDNSGNAFVTGGTDGTTIFDSNNIISAGGFVAKFSTIDGSCLWAKNITDIQNYPVGRVKYADGNLYITGTAINDTLMIDTALVYCDSIDLWVAKFDTSGNVQWVRTFGGPNADQGGYMSVDGNKNSYVAGTFKDTAFFDGDTITNSNGLDWFLAKYDSSGNFIWVRQANADASDLSSRSVSSDVNGFTYVTGQFYGSATFGTYNITAVDSPEAFVVRYSSNGTCLGAEHFGIAKGMDVIQDGNGAFYLSGGFRFTISLGSDTLTSFGNQDFFLAKHDELTGEEEERLANSNQLLIYANPNTGKCTVQVPQDFLHESNLLLSIFDTKGSLIQQSTLEMNDGKIKLNIEAQARGMYNITLSNGRKRYNGRIVFE